MLPYVPFPGFWYFIALFVAMIAWRLWGDRVIKAVKLFDQKRREADLQTFYDRMNPNAHFRQSVEQINEDTPPVTFDPQGTPSWNGIEFASREEAENTRWFHVLHQARIFYQDLDRSLGHRIARRPKGEKLHRSDSRSE